VRFALDQDGDIFLVTDAYRHGNDGKIMMPFYADSDPHKKGAHRIGEVTQFYLQADEASMRARYSKLRPGYRFQTLEYMFAISAKDINVPDKPRMHFSGTTRGDAIGPIKYPKFEDMSQIAWEEKKKVYGANIRRVGGPGPDVADEKPEPRKNNALEPMFYHQPPKALLDEFIHSFSCRKGLRACPYVRPQSIFLFRGLVLSSGART